jgi:thiol:disulfide interchange protein DsbD
MERRNPNPTAASYLAAIVSSALASLMASGVCASADASAPAAGAAHGAHVAHVGIGPLSHQAAQAESSARLVRAELVPALVRAPGGGEAIAIAVTVAPDWHIYWRNPGDSGAAPSVKLELPAGWSAGPLSYPRPEIFGDADERTFGYSGTVHLLIPVTRPEGWQGAIDARGELSWLACKRSCVAGRSPLAGQVSTDAAALADAPGGRAWPGQLPAGSAALVSGEGAARTLAISLGSVPESEKVRFIPDDCTGIRWGDGTGPFELRWDAATRLWRLQTPLSVVSGDAPGGVPRARGLVLAGADPAGPAYFVDIPVPAAPTLTSP